MDVRVGLWRKLSTEKLMLLNYGVGEDSWESLWWQGDPTSPSWRSVLGVHWKDWCWSWNSSTLATSCKELNRLKRPWCREGLRVGEGNNRGWDGWMASPTRWAWVWVNSRSLWWTGRPGVLWFIMSQRVGHNWLTELNWIKPHYSKEWQWYVLATNNMWCKPLYCKQNKAKHKQNKQKLYKASFHSTSHRKYESGNHNRWMTYLLSMQRLFSYCEKILFW